MVDYIRERIETVIGGFRRKLDSAHNKVLSSVTEIQLWIPRKISELTQWLFQVLYISLQLTITLIIVVIISHLLYFVIRSRVVPKALINEVVHFDYISSPPVARIALNRIEKQWTYISQPSPIESLLSNSSVQPKENKSRYQVTKDKRFLKSGGKYNVDMTFKMAKSANNYALGKFVATLTMIDSDSHPVASSVRPIIIPYQAPHVAYIDALVQYITFPVYGRSDLVSVSVLMMNEYEEPPLHLPWTDVLQIELSSQSFDLIETHITMMPKLRGVSYYMFYFPTYSFVVGVTLLTGIQIFVYSITFVIALLVRHLNASSVNSQSSRGTSRSGSDSGNESEDTSDRLLGDNSSGLSSSDSQRSRERSLSRPTGGVNVIEDHSVEDSTVGLRLRTKGETVD